MSVCVIPCEARRIHKALQRDKNEKDDKKAMEINVASLSKQLKEMTIKVPKKGMQIPDKYVIYDSNLKLHEFILDKD